MSRALLLGAGGVTGVAWETGVLDGRNTLDASKRAASAEEGLRQAGQVHAAIAAVWR